jgi:lambda repressor-like predicted transcriptional regulator
MSVPNVRRVRGLPSSLEIQLTPASRKRAGRPVVSLSEVYEHWERIKGPDYFLRLVREDSAADDVKAALWSKGTSLSRIAKEHGLDRRDLGRALSPATLHDCRVRIAEAVGLTVHELWPSLYNANGHPRACQCSKDAAA